MDELNQQLIQKNEHIQNIEAQVVKLTEHVEKLKNNPGQN